MDDQDKLQAAAGASALNAALADEVTVSAEIAALYLRMPPADLAESQKPKRPEGRPDKSMKPPSAPTTYTLGVVRALAAKLPASPAPDAAIKAGTVGWVSAKLPFFAELEPRVKRGRRVLIGSAWGASGPERETLFADLVAGRIRCAWLTSSEAAASLWSDEASHRAFAARGLALLEGEVRAIQAAISASEALGAGTPASGDQPVA